DAEAEEPCPVGHTGELDESVLGWPGAQHGGLRSGRGILSEQGERIDRASPEILVEVQPQPLDCLWWSDAGGQRVGALQADDDRRELAVHGVHRLDEGRVARRVDGEPVARVRITRELEVAGPHLAGHGERGTWAFRSDPKPGF